MTAPIDHGAMEAPLRKPAGMADYEARNAIRELVRIYGEGGARELVTMYLHDEARRIRHA